MLDASASLYTAVGCNDGYNVRNEEHRGQKFFSEPFVFDFVNLPAVVDGEDCIKLEYTVSYFDAGKGWTLVDDTSTFSDGCSTCEVFSTLNGTASMDCDITLSECRNGIIL